MSKPDAIQGFKYNDNHLINYVERHANGDRK